jgi:3-hydroxymyristoyl/3-hydroxydecanoyl-(acyl carrier protein) dehydratase
LDYPKGIGLATDEDLFQKIVLPKEEYGLEFINIERQKIAQYYQISVVEVEQVITY